MIIFCCCGSRCSNPSRHPNYTTTTTTHTIRCHVLCWLLPQYNFNGENITILALIKKIDISEKNPLAPISSHSFHLVWHLLFDDFIYPRIKCTFAAAHNLWWSVLGEWIWCDLVFTTTKLVTGCWLTGLGLQAWHVGDPCNYIWGDQTYISKSPQHFTLILSILFALICCHNTTGLMLYWGRKYLGN